MSSKKKQGPSAPKKASFFSFGRNKAKSKDASTSEAPKTDAETSTATYTALTTAALFSSKKKESTKPASEGSKKSSKGKNSKLNKKQIITVHQPRADAIVPSPIPSLTNQSTLKSAFITEGGAISKQEVNSSTNQITDEQRDTAAIKIQAAFKGHRERRNYVQKRQKAIKVEALARGFLARKMFAKMKSGQGPSTGGDVQGQN
ncbi:Unconventional myosin-IXb [Orchesella cincta]|uniref:Unconventional myosin-IXb n=1 Tax=Orchesella cincta TaxID=48709 RepID=A0A1D2MTZ1_ORCCI|nr:Unconventional myosin-IXb [Orchesella cincta]